ncbi:exocyst complex component exo84 [Rhizophlyctis rosea]|nr:exocyst complex component exo84 [Rhizophlyctis rosea]
MSVDKCWGLVDLAVIDVKDSADVTNAFRIMKHPDVFLYRTETMEDKRGLLAAIKRLTDDLMTAKRLAVDTNLTRTATDEDKPPDVTTQADSAADALFLANPFTGEPRHVQVLRDDLSGGDVKYLSELPDELDVLIAHREFEKAVEFVERASQTLLQATHDTPRVIALRAAIEERTARLAGLISIDLANPVNNKGAVQANIDMLLRLKLGDQARDYFLTSRSVIIRHRIRLLRFDGDIATYINDLAELVFRLIRNTADWYGSSFSETTMASGFMKWVRQEVEAFGDVFRRQLKEVGLDLSFVLEDMFYPDLVTAVEEHAGRCQKDIVKAVGEDNFVVVDAKEEDAEFPVKVSKSVHTLYSILMDFGADMGLVMSITLYRKIVSALTDFFRSHVHQLLAVFDKGWSLKQCGVILVNATFVVEELLPRVTSQLAMKFERPIPELDDMKLKLEDTITQVRKSFVRVSTHRFIKEGYNFPTIDYSSNAAILDTIKPSEDIIKLLHQLDRVALELDESLDRKGILEEIVEALFEFMNEGVQLFFLDIHFFLRTASKIITPHTTDLGNAICERALRKYFLQNKDMVGGLKSGEWFDKRVEAVLKEVTGQFGVLMDLGDGGSTVETPAATK